MNLRVQQAERILYVIDIKSIDFLVESLNKTKTRTRHLRLMFFFFFFICQSRQLLSKHDKNCVQKRNLIIYFNRVKRTWIMKSIIKPNQIL